MAIRHVLILATVLVVAALYGCGAAPDSGSTESSGPSESTDRPGETTKRPETTPGHTGSSRPPESTLSYGGETVIGGLGSFCWSSGSVSKCADSFGVVVRDEVLSVPTGSTLTFVYGGEKLGSLNAAAYTIGKENHLENIGESSVLVPEGKKGFKTVPLPARRSGNRAHIAAELPAGNYVVETFVKVPQGDASYGFHIVVE